MNIKLAALSAAAAVISAALAARVYSIINDESVVRASAGRGQYVITDVCGYAPIYDCKGRKLNNTSIIYKVLIDPNSVNALIAAPYVSDTESYRNGMKGNLPFLCRAETDEIPGAVVFRKYVREDENQTARHIVGYTSEGEGVCGIEGAYNDFIRGNFTVNEARFSVNAVGGVINGLYSSVKYAEEPEAGVVTTIDRDIQLICEEAMKEHGCVKGAIIVMDVKSGEIRACASYPEFDPSCPEKSLDRSDAPFVNRAFSAYSVGSVFKLVTSAAAMEIGISPDFCCICTGSADVNGQVFNCHKWGGHGELDMGSALVSSCNPYFITLSQYIDSGSFINTAKELGFGQETVFGDGLVSAAGYLPDERELSVKAEKANFSFGQGKLSATPLQICAMTAAIANNGFYSCPKLITGISDGENISKKEYPARKRVMSYKTAKKLKGYMREVTEAENSMSRPENVSAAGKTSTAQTGRYGQDGKEETNCWYTGFFPAVCPEYAVTVLIEDGISGNVTCGPVFKQTAEKITELKVMSYEL